MKLNRDALLILKKAIIYFAAAFVAALLQTSLLAVIAPFGSVPDLVLLLVLGAGYFCGPAVGGIFGLVAGVISYAIGGIGFAVEPLLYTAVGAFTGFLVENFFKGKFSVWCFYVIFAAIMKGGVSLLVIMLFSSDLQLFASIWRTLIPEFIGTVVLGAALYLPVRRVCVYF